MLLHNPDSVQTVHILFPTRGINTEEKTEMWISVPVHK